MKKTPLLHFLLWGFVICLGLMAGPALAQTATGSITGRITDSAGEGLPGVTVLVQGTTKGAATDVSGNFTIQNVPVGAYTVTASSVGMTTVRQQVTVAEGGTATFDAKMGEDATQLSEVVVVGYGTTRRQDVTGAVATVSTKEFVQGQVVNPANLIVGKLAGVSVTPPSGAPGASSPIRIRGGASLNASNDPLIVIDGVPVDNNGISGAPDALSLINPNDIETFTVLKDASATAIYGSRASNGVILITTKKGLRGEKLRLNFNTQFSVSRNTKKVDVMSADEFRKFINDTTRTPAQAVASKTQRDLLGTASTDWQDEIYRTGYTSDNNLSLTGSIAEKVPFRASLGYLNQQGTLRGGNLRRNTASIGVTPSLLDDHLKIDLNAKGVISDNLFANEGAIGSAVFFDPTQPVRSNDTTFTPFGNYFQWTDANGNLVGLAPRNPVALLEQRRDRSTVKRLLGNVQFDYKMHFLPELRAVLNLGYDLSRSNGTTDIPGNAGGSYNNTTPSLSGVRSLFEQKKDNKVLDFYFNYAKDLGTSGLRADLTAGYSYQDFRFRTPQLAKGRAANGEYTNLIDTLTLASDAGYTLLSYFGRANLAFKDRYLLTGTIRNDQTSRFSPNQRSGWFPAAAVAWRIKGEEFLAASSAVSDLKLRVGYGKTGQQDVGQNYYPYLARYRRSNNTAQYFDGTNALPTLRAGGYNTDLKWETTTTFNYGLDYGFLDNRIYGSLEYYVRKSTDLLAEIAVPAGTNLTNRLLVNIGELENKGVEASVTVVPVRNDNITWSVNLNATRNKQEITKLLGGTDFIGYKVGGIAGGTGNTAQINSVGYAPNVFYVYEQAYGENGKPLLDVNGAPVFVNQNGDSTGTSPLINEKDLIRYKQIQPKIFLGLSSNFSYKQLSFAFTMRANLGNYVYNNVASNSSFYRSYLGAQTYLNNGINDVGNSGFVTDDSRLSNYYVEDASFVRMDNATVGYDFGSLIKEGTNLRVSFAVQNVFLITKYSGLDPEVGGGIDNNFYPRPRTYTLGLNVSF